MERVRKRFPTQPSENVRRPEFTRSKAFSRPVQNIPSKQYAKRNRFKLGSISPKLDTDIVRNIGVNIFHNLIKFIKSDFLRSRKFQYLMLPLLIIFIIFSYGYYWYFYTLGSLFSVTIKYKFKNIDETRQIPLDNSNTDIKPVELSTEESATGFFSTTGEKATGEKSTGSVSVFNPTTEIKVLPAGTTLTCISTSCNSLTFVTVNDLNVGPGNSDEVKVTAGDIGENYNIQPGNRFKVGQADPNNEVLASNIKPLAGGTPKKMVKVVAKSDIAKAEESAMLNIKETLLKKISQDPANEGYILAENSATVTKVNTTADKKEEEEADVVNVTVKSKIIVNAVKGEQINQYITKFKDELTPNGYYLDEKLTKTSSDILDKGKGKIEISVKLTSIARTKIDTDSLKKSLSGKKYSESEKILSEIPNIISYTKTFEPKTLPQFFWKIPSDPDRIQVKLVAEEG